MEFKCHYCGNKVIRRSSIVLKYKSNYCSQKCKKLDQVNIDPKGRFTEKHKNQVLDGFLLCTNCLKYKNPSKFYRASHLKHRLQREYFCKKCRDITRKRDYQKEKPNKIKHRSKLEPFLRSLICHAKNRSLRKGCDFNLSYEYLNSLYNSSEGYCSISGIKMTTIAGKGRVRTNISVDRIDSSEGYIEGNVQLVCFTVNVMKQDMTSDEFINWVNKIHKHND